MNHELSDSEALARSDAADAAFLEKQTLYPEFLGYLKEKGIDVSKHDGLARYVQNAKDLRAGTRFFFTPKYLILSCLMKDSFYRANTIETFVVHWKLGNRADGGAEGEFSRIEDEWVLERVWEKIANSNPHDPAGYHFFLGVRIRNVRTGKPFSLGNRESEHFMDNCNYLHFSDLKLK